MLLLLLGSRVTLIKHFIDQSGDIVNHIMEYLLQLMPFSIGMSIFTLVVGGGLSSLSSVAKLLIVFVALVILTMLWNLLFTCLRWKKKIPDFLRDTLPVMITSFSTSSSSSVLSMSMEICENKLGIDRKLVSFGIPMSLSIYKLGAAIYDVALAFGLAEIFGVAITPLWVITCALIAFCLSLAVPAVPGGTISILTLLLAQLGIPSEALALALACDLIMDRFATACSCYSGVTELSISPKNYI